MYPLVDIEAIERRAVHATFEDGLLDCVLGLTLASFALAIALEHAFPLDDLWVALLSIPLFAGYFLGKLLITNPRIGRVEFRKPRKRSLRRLMIFLSLVTATALAFSGAVLFFMPADWHTGGSFLFPMIWFCMFAISFAIIGFVTDIVRFHYYGLIIAVTMPAQQVLKYLGHPWQVCLIPYLVGAVMLCAVGLVFLIRFLRLYPIPHQEPDHA